ncbi:MAG: hypothetical protein U0163_15105 [Gemmatimonadaceae bacterium]
MPGLRLAVMCAVLSLWSGRAVAQARTLSQQVRNYASISAPVVALTHVRVIDGTGAPARDDQTIVITGDRITAIGGAEVSVPADAQVVDLTGHTAIPGLVGLHDHMYYSPRPAAR